MRPGEVISWSVSLVISHICAEDRAAPGRAWQGRLSAWGLLGAAWSFGAGPTAHIATPSHPRPSHNCPAIHSSFFWSNARNPYLPTSPLLQPVLTVQMFGESSSAALISAAAIQATTTLINSHELDSNCFISLHV